MFFGSSCRTWYQNLVVKTDVRTKMPVLCEFEQVYFPWCQRCASHENIGLPIKISFIGLLYEINEMLMVKCLELCLVLYWAL
jgi:hypothetical protein